MMLLLLAVSWAWGQDGRPPLSRSVPKYPKPVLLADQECVASLIVSPDGRPHLYDVSCAGRFATAVERALRRWRWPPAAEAWSDRIRFTFKESGPPPAPAPVPTSERCEIRMSARSGAYRLVTADGTRVGDLVLRITAASAGWVVDTRLSMRADARQGAREEAAQALLTNHGALSEATVRFTVGQRPPSADAAAAWEDIRRSLPPEIRGAPLIGEGPLDGELRLFPSGGREIVATRSLVGGGQSTRSVPADTLPEGIALALGMPPDSPTGRCTLDVLPVDDWPRTQRLTLAAGRIQADDPEDVLLLVPCSAPGTGCDTRVP